MRAGEYARPKDVVCAAVISLLARETAAAFGARDTERLLAEGEESLRKYGTLDAMEALRGRRQRPAQIG
ncbi:MAG: hypothetical protein HUU22_03285 [Phycisphaerae bacterium]|nr:hypothetical protein [Phycisphaerae bacterium]NUQ45039.1 hypothetical protein [Phycisphaerae bacterium]